jgi:hypothetical protein
MRSHASSVANPDLTPLPAGGGVNIPILEARALAGEIVEAITVVVPRKNYAGLVSHAAHREAGCRGTSVPIQIAVLCVIGVLVAPVVIAATEPEEASATVKVIAAKVAARLVMQTRKAATESHAMTGEMASAKAAAYMTAAEPAAHMTASAEPAAHMTPTAEPPSVSTSTSPAAVRKRVGG